MMDLAGAISKIEELAVEASKAGAFDLHFEPGRARIFNSHTGQLEYQPIPNKYLDATVFGLDDLVTVYNGLKTGSDGCSVWVGSESVVLFASAAMLDKAVLPLRINPHLSALQSLTNLTPKELHTKLRVSLFDASVSPVDFKEVMACLKFEVNETSESRILKGDESIGRQVRAKVTGESDIPDGVVFSFSVYPDLPQLNTQVDVACAVITEPASGTISVIPYPGELKRVMLESMAVVAGWLRTAVSVPVICGSCK